MANSDASYADFKSGMKAEDGEAGAGTKPSARPLPAGWGKSTIGSRDARHNAASEYRAHWQEERLPLYNGKTIAAK